MWRFKTVRVVLAVLLGFSLWSHPEAADAAKLILALGDASYISPTAAKAWTGAEVERVLGEYELEEFAVVILSNVPYSGLPGPVREGLSNFLGRGGSLLITGGPNSYGSGGYQAIADVIPFEIRAERDWRARPFKAVIPIQPGSPIIAEVTFQTVGNFNDLNPKAGAVEIARYSGGRVVGGLGGGAVFQSPLIAEQAVGAGTVVGIAFDLGQEVQGGWADGGRFLQNLLGYLVARSPLEPKPKEEESGGRK